MVYQYDYVDSTQMTLQSLLKARDIMLRVNVPSEVEGMERTNFVLENLTVPTFRFSGFTSVSSMQNEIMMGRL